MGIEAQTPLGVFLKLVEVAGEDILIGDQALALWVEHYGITCPWASQPRIHKGLFSLGRLQFLHRSRRRFL